MSSEKEEVLTNNDDVSVTKKSDDLVTKKRSLNEVSFFRYFCLNTFNIDLIFTSIMILTSSILIANRLSINEIKLI